MGYLTLPKFQNLVKFIQTYLNQIAPFSIERGDSLLDEIENCYCALTIRLVSITLLSIINE